MDNNEKAVQDALNKALEVIRDKIGDPNSRAMLYGKVKEAQLIHKGMLRDR